MVTAALFSIAKKWKQPKCASTEEKIKMTWYIYKMEYHSAIKKNELTPFVATQVGLEIMILSEENQTYKDISYNITCIWNLKYDTNEFTYKTEIDSQT